MSKTAINGMRTKKDNNGNAMTKKATSHGSYRCKRKPTSKRCQN